MATDNFILSATRRIAFYSFPYKYPNVFGILSIDPSIRKGVKNKQLCPPKNKKKQKNVKKQQLCQSKKKKKNVNIYTEYFGFILGRNIGMNICAKIKLLISVLQLPFQFPSFWQTLCWPLLAKLCLKLETQN